MTNFEQKIRRIHAIEQVYNTIKNDKRWVMVETGETNSEGDTIYRYPCEEDGWGWETDRAKADIFDEVLKFLEDMIK
ncbi:MAG: hypothetical protein E7190_00440 [Erysipelotrichaceae bacterium]|nr:hypothetical protein [Erysipelotrichaceae bacterium]